MSAQWHEPASGGVWRTVERPGYLGGRRDAAEREWDAHYGPGGWRLAWKVGDIVVVRAAALMLYEDAYYEFLQARPEVLDTLCAAGEDVYDTAETNVASGLDYDIQEDRRNHIHDISIRRAVLRLGRRFEGNGLVWIRDIASPHPLSLPLSPGRVPFHLPHLIEQPELTGWWQPGTVESFYQSNKVLQVPA